MAMLSRGPRFRIRPVPFFNNSGILIRPLVSLFRSGLWAPALAMVLLVPAGPGAADNGKEDVFFASQHSAYDVRAAGTARAGVAIPGGIGSASTNPALPRAYARGLDLKGLMASAGYGRLPVFDRHVVPAAIAFNSEEYGLFGLCGRYLDGGTQQRQYELSVVYSGRMFDKSMDQGAVDFGVAIRYERMRWMYTGLDTLFSRHFSRSTDSEIGFVNDSIWPDTQVPSHGYLFQQRLILDVGLYQAKISDRVDFGVVFHNVLGRYWNQERPQVKSNVTDEQKAHVYDEQGIPFDRVDEYVLETHYSDTMSKVSSDWLASNHRRITAGIAFTTPILDDKVWLVVPVDLEMIGIFDRSFKTRFLFRSGVEAVIQERFAARLGYAREPEDVMRGDGDDFPKYSNVLTAGAGVIFSPVAIDFAVARSRWLVSVSVVY